ncbi:MAG: DUF1573 domain-containing protein [Planctomycetes bacterium]|nr:DUF1573 domain-containing protein [Planctomycetota bacterium]
MKYLVLALIPLLAGVSVGVARTIREFDGIVEWFSPYADGSESAGIVTGVKKDPSKMPRYLDAINGSRVVVENGEKHNFGQMYLQGKMSHKFVFRNTGTADLKLKQNGTSCMMCTFSSFDQATVKPGESVDIEIRWEAKHRDAEFRKEAYVATSDPDRPTVALTIEGAVVMSIFIMPNDLVLNNVPVGGVTRGQVQVMNFKDDTMKLIDFRFVNEEIAEFFELSEAPLQEKYLSGPSTSRPKTGRTIVVTIKPGMPLGSFTQTVRFNLDVPGGSEQLFNIRGFVTSDISFAGQGYTAKNNDVSWGTVARGAKYNLIALVRGEHREQTRFKILNVTPSSSLRATVSDPEPFGEAAMKSVLTIEIPDDAIPVSLLGGPEQENYGHIVLETTHPDVKRLTILVRFAVDE